MKNKTIFLLLAWTICFVLALEAAYYLLNQKDTFLNIVGIVFLTSCIFTSVLTKCFTRNPFKK